MIALPILVGLSVLVLLGAVMHDVAFRTIPNWMSATLLFLGGGIRSLDGAVLPGLLASTMILLGASLCWRRGWLGGGDVKLLAACGLLVPPALAVSMVLDTALAGGGLALLYLVLGKVLTGPSAMRPIRLMPRIIRVERRRIARRGPLPYASAIATGALFVMLKGY